MGGPSRPGFAPGNRPCAGTPAASEVVAAGNANTHFPHPLPTEAAEPAGAERAADPRAMGNIQKKLTRKSEGGKRQDRGAPRRGRAPEARADKRGQTRDSATAGGANGHPGGRRGAGDPAACAFPEPATLPPAPVAPVGPAGLKSQGNELFKHGQFAEAALKYSAAIAQLEPAGEGAAPAGALGPRAAARGT